MGDVAWHNPSQHPGGGVRLSFGGSDEVRAGSGQAVDPPGVRVQVRRSVLDTVLVLVGTAGQA